MRREVNGSHREVSGNGKLMEVIEKLVGMGS
jgi:Na+-translocating ferredoxin:NAD+ oxidoreductase RnfE subunit